MLLLAFDTATPAVTVALHDGQRVLAETVTVDARRHGELLAPSIAKVIADAGAEPGDLTAIVAGVGPGPYTGLRVGVVTARVFGRTLGIPVYGVCTLDVLARAARPAAAGREFLAVTDARRKELYWARYDGSGRGSPALPSAAPPRSRMAPRCPSRARRRRSTRMTSASRSGASTPPRPSWPNWSRSASAGPMAGRCAQWRLPGCRTARAWIFSRRSRCTCAGRTPGFPGRRSG